MHTWIKDSQINDWKMLTNRIFFSDDGNHTFLQYACDHGYDDIVKYLLGQFNSVTQIHRK